MDKEADIKKMLEQLENKIEVVNMTLNLLCDILNKYTLKVDKALITWKYEEKERLGLSNKNVGLPTIDDNIIIALYNQGFSINGIAKKLDCNRSTVIRHMNKLKSTGAIKERDNK